MSNFFLMGDILPLYSAYGKQPWPVYGLWPPSLVPDQPNFSGDDKKRQTRYQNRSMTGRLNE